jgi:predicted metal-dependent HD superfamily phosphohydrolase
MLSNLQKRWIKFSTRVTIPQRELLWKNFVSLYTEDNRHFHDLLHIEDCLTKLDNWPTYIPATMRDTIELAIWFHDIIYDTRKADNEESSAALTIHYLRGHTLATDCHALILATRHKQTAGMREEEIMCDIALSILGAEPEIYRRYTENIRKEYHWVETDQYAEARAKILTNFLDRERLFQTPSAHERWEKQARLNIAKERAVLNKMITSNVQ